MCRKLLFVLLAALVCTSPFVVADSVKPPVTIKAEFVDGYFVSRRMASVRIGDGGGASGTIFLIAQHGGVDCGYGVTVAHAGYKINSEFKVWYIDGSSAKARCIDVDESTDLMLFVVNANTVLGVAPFSDEELDGHAYVVGFPDTEGPKERSIEYIGPENMQEQGTDKYFDRDEWMIMDGPVYWPGYSGGGVFEDENLVGVMSHASKSTCSTAKQAQIKRFVQRKGRFGNCDNGSCKPHGPRDLGWLKPNVDIGIPKRPDRPEHRIDNPRRPDINRDREQKQAIAELQQQVKLLVARVDALEAAQVQIGDPYEPVNPEEPPPAPVSTDTDKIEAVVRNVIRTMDLKGPKGEPGKDGTISKDVLASVIADVLADKSLKVVFEKGDDPDEPDREVLVKLINGELRIPPTTLRIRNVDEDGNPIGTPIADTAPLGMPLKMRYERNTRGK